MTAERWKLIEHVFESALEIPDRERAAFLERASNGDAELLREVETLFTADGAYANAIQSAIRTQALDLGSYGDALIGRRLGVWRITGVLGHGGMGDVYEAVPEVKEIGVGITLLPHAVRELAGLGLQAELEAAGILRTEDGREIRREIHNTINYVPTGN